ncbi:fimbrial protein [Serratia marcescens]|uniref:fimbrial protein n=1 Tax=Serratia marcescens TaxID=615 RepID=UPI000A19325C|nr:hypothetical protein [Serratia marcescens]
MITTVKRKMLPLVLLTVAMLAPPLYAADGNINVFGRVVESACVTDESSRNQVLNFGAVTYWEVEKEFHIVLKDCPVSTSQAQVRFEGLKADWGWGYVFAANNTAEPGAAKGIGFLIRYYPEDSDAIYLAPNGLSDAITLQTGAGVANKLAFTAAVDGNFEHEHGFVGEPGKAVADVQFSIVYP